MLYRTVISPSVFAELPESESEKKLFCGAVSRLLTDFTENCVVLVDPDKVTLNDIHSLIGDWPPSSRKKIKDIIKTLATRNRFIKTASLGRHSLSPKHNSCNFLPGVLAAYPSTPVITGNNCCVASCGVMNNGSVITVSDYPDSSFLKEQRRNQDIVIADREWNKKVFEENILVPTFRDSKHVKIIDRYIGRSVVSGKKGSIKVKNKLDTPYQETIRWLIDVFYKRTCRKKDRSFEIYTGIIMSQRLSESDCSKISVALKDIEESFSKDYPFPIRIIVKKERSAQDNNKIGPEMPHDRYLITDQIGINVGRGFNLFRSGDPDVRDVHIKIVQEKAKNKVSAEVRKLPDL